MSDWYPLNQYFRTRTGKYKNVKFGSHEIPNTTLENKPQIYTQLSDCTADFGSNLSSDWREEREAKNAFKKSRFRLLGKTFGSAFSTESSTEWNSALIN